MTAAHSFELSPHSGAPAEAVDAAVSGQVVHLMRDGQPVAADVATARGLPLSRRWKQLRISALLVLRWLTAHVIPVAEYAGES